MHGEAHLATRIFSMHARIRMEVPENIMRCLDFVIESWEPCKRSIIDGEITKSSTKYTVSTFIIRERA